MAASKLVLVLLQCLAAAASHGVKQFLCIAVACVVDVSTTADLCSTPKRKAILFGLRFAPGAEDGNESFRMRSGSEFGVARAKEGIRRVRSLC